jgi:gluconate 2-dehydrogenase alpha chain
MANKNMKAVDVVIVGFGWTGAIMAKEMTEAGQSVVALERGVYRDTYPDGAYPKTINELEYQQRFKLFQNLNKSSFTFRRKTGDSDSETVGWFKFDIPRPDKPSDLCLAACSRDEI